MDATQRRDREPTPGADAPSRGVGGGSAPAFDLADIAGQAASGSGRVWGSIAAMRLSLTIDENVLAPNPHDIVLVNVGRPFRLEETLDGRVYQTGGMRGDVAVIPAGAELVGRTRERAPQQVEAFAMVLPPGFVRSAAERAGIGPGGIELEGVVAARDPAVERIAMALLAEVEGGGLLGDLYADGLATALAAQVVRNHSSLGKHAARAAERAPTGLSPEALRRVLNHIEARLDHSLAVADLAAVAHLSPFHFARLFRRSTGCSPHEYVLRRRVERARELLAYGDLSLADVAQRAGFADQSHLAKHTRRLLGTTPGALRRARR